MELSCLKGLGLKRIQTLNGKGIFTAEDLLFYFPKTYYDLESKDSFQEDGKYKLIACRVVSDIKISRIRKDFSYCYCECLDAYDNKFKAIWYNQPYIKNAVKNEDKLYLYGKNSNTKHGYFIVSNYKNSNKIEEGTKLLSVYKSFKNVGQSVIANAIKEALAKTTVLDILPETYEKENNILGMNKALNIIHNPTDSLSLKEAKQRLDIEKILPVIKINEELKNAKSTLKKRKYSDFDIVLDKFCEFLPYDLTESQLKVLADIREDLTSKNVMNRLVQGDVGTGKTIVALIASAVCLHNGYSSVLIAPTEILARQHYEEAVRYFDKLGKRVCFLSSSVSQRERKDIINRVNSDEPVLLVGTHSCLTDEIQSDNIALVVIDEQHRFGVNQRAFLTKRNAETELLMLSATPIPRSLSIVYYGGLDISILSNPPKAKHIQTNIVGEAKEEDMWGFIKSKMDTGSKVYVVCGNIDDNDDDSYQGLSVKAMYEKLCKRFSKELVLMAHGRLDSETENKTLNLFKNGSYKILVSTTIIEVGVDVKDADIMVIVSPEKFGLATLHQLRGRIGRAGQQSYCFCLSQNLNDVSYERIKYFKEHDNGFDIAEYDYKSRGAGDVLGTAQHGKLENIFDFISLETYNKAKHIYEEISDQLQLFNNKTYLDLAGIALN